ncbi:Re/Si-specific NAD(P)(+) transhydrogenase subunit alpha [Gallaecimonas sp. GXIMD4217]|uniref:Re/Si-specific NAD(P)(+) transhydrogenase subunit alpha n=1 Tax=Gallaecimonas sp. GXIMD4217 TaxID=3131927 RepID=UPI00311B38C4
MQIGIPKESLSGEARVAATPKSAAALIELGFDVIIEAGAGKAASFDDGSYEASGAKIGDPWQADILLKVNAPSGDEVKRLRASTLLVSFIWPAQQPELVDRLKARGVTVLAMDMVPRISRAQNLDALSAMANIAGYRAVVEAASAFGRFFSGQITAAGKVAPAKVLVIGAGVAGLAALGAAGSLGAVVRAFDTRPEVREQVQSLGAEFLELAVAEEGGGADGYAKEMSQAYIDAEMALLAEQAAEVDVIITTALIPGKPAPRLISRDMVKAMKPGSVIVDLAAPNGGNCELTKPGRRVKSDNGVIILGYTDLPSRLPGQASSLYGANLVNLLRLLCPAGDGQIALDLDDEVLRHMAVLKDGELLYPPPPIAVSKAPPKPKPQPAPAEIKAPEPVSPRRKALWYGAGLLAFAWVASVAPAAFLGHFTVFVLACVLGYYVIWNVTHALHTPLMSVTNAISGIIIVGALLQIGQGGLVGVLAFIAVLIASINLAGGFLVTRRMLKMFRRDQ